MSVVARRIRATPERSASETWRAIVDLLAPGNESARVCFKPLPSMCCKRLRRIQSAA